LIKKRKKVFIPKRINLETEQKICQMYKDGKSGFEIRICGTREIVLWILKALDKDNLKIHQRHKSNINNWQVNIGGNIQVLKILNALYSDTSIYLERKYKKYLELQDYMKK
jgi:hypothetical protein